MTSSEHEPRPPLSDLVSSLGGLTTVGLLTERLPVAILAEHQGKLTMVAAGVTALGLTLLHAISKQRPAPAAEDLE